MKLAVDQGWGMNALIPQGASLEDIFVELTTREGASSEAAA